MIVRTRSLALTDDFFLNVGIPEGKSFYGVKPVVGTFVEVAIWPAVVDFNAEICQVPIVFLEMPGKGMRGIFIVPWVTLSQRTIHNFSLAYGKIELALRLSNQLRIGCGHNEGTISPVDGIAWLSPLEVSSPQLT
jgi:hypothetical protein